MQDGMVLYASYVEKFRSLTDEQFGRLIRFVMQYQIDGIVPEIDDLVVSLSFDFIKTDLDKNNKRYEEICEQRRIAGAKGGLAKASKRKQMLANDSNSYQMLPNVSKSSNINKIKENKIKGNLNELDIKVECIDTVSETENTVSIPYQKDKARRFVPPTIEEVADYCRERNNNVDAQRFVDFYTAKGWMVGSNKMKDWKAAVRTWERRQTQETKPQEPPVDPNTQKRRDKYKELEDFYLNN